MRTCEKPLADDFLDAFPRYRLEERLEKLRRERQGLEEKVEQRVRRRGFDLSRVGAEQRRTVAQRFVEAHDKIRDFACYQQDLETAGRLAQEWCAQVCLVCTTDRWSAQRRPPGRRTIGGVAGIDRPAAIASPARCHPKGRAST
jgi:hypothetical protein